jgi:hypothetical protein
MPARRAGPVSEQKCMKMKFYYYTATLGPAQWTPVGAAITTERPYSDSRRTEIGAA